MDYKLQTLGMPMEVLRVSYINYFEFTDRYSTVEHSHNFCELLYVDKGKIMVHSESFSGELSVNQLIIHRPNELHSLSTVDSVAPNVINIGFECTCKQLAHFAKTPVTLTFDYSNLLARTMQEAMNYFEPPYDIPYTSYMKKRKEYPFGSNQMIKINLESLLISLVRDFQSNICTSKSVHTQKTTNIQAVHQYLTENFTSKITLDSLCFIFGTNKTTLCKQFKQEYGTTILNYINSLRIKEAKSLLRANKMSITEIADNLGFESIHYFCRLFKKTVGQTPTDYSKTIKAKLNI